ncbi:diacylglycerol kinase family protein [bacterium 3DAC]|nr:diacylglycerol kinase family protein [bacterium 3DAC]
MNTSETPSGNRLYKSFIYGLRGIRFLLSQRNYRIAIYVTTAGGLLFLWLDRSFLPIFLVMSAVVLVSEGTNSAIEALCDFVHEDHHPVIGRIKDMAAGNTVVAVAIASVIGLWEFIKLWGPLYGIGLWAVAIAVIFIIFSIWG